MNEQDAGKASGATPPKKSSVIGKKSRWTAVSVGGLLCTVILIVVVVVFVTFGIPIDLSRLRGTLEGAASEALGRRITIEGPIKLEPTVWPTVQVEGVHVGNPEGWPDANFAQLNRARAQLGVLALLKGDVRIGEVSVEGLRVRMDVNAEGEPNWLFAETEEKPEPGKQESDEAPALRFVELRELMFRDIAISYRDATTGQALDVKLDEVAGGAEQRKPLQLAIKGTAQEMPYTVTFTGGSLDTLMDGDEPWPMEFVTEVAGASVRMAGEIGDPLRGADVALDFDIKGPMMKDLEGLLGTTLPPIRSFEFHGRIEEAEGTYRIADLNGTVGGTAFTGGFEADATGKRPRLLGSLDVQSIDVGPFFSAIDELEDGQVEEAKPTNQQAVEPEKADNALDIDDPILTLEPLGNFDAQFNLAIHQVVNGPAGLRDASLKVVIADGALTAPMAVTVAEVPFKGEISLAPEDETPKVSVSLWAEKSDIGELARFMMGAEGVEGGFGRAELDLSARGETIRSLAQTAELRFAIAGASLSYGNEAGGTPVEFTLEHADMVVPAVERAKAAATGTLLGEPFSVEFSGGTFLDSYIARTWPIELSAAGGGAQLRVDGTVVEGRRGAGTNFTFDLAGKRIGGLATWVGVSPKARSRYKLSGTVMVTDTGTRAGIKEARIGNSAFTGDVGIREEGEDLISFAKITANVIDVQELAGLAPEAKEQPKAEAKKQSRPSDREGLAIDVPIMPQGFEIFDTDIDLAIKRIRLDPADVTQVAFATKIRDGFVNKAPFHATVAGAVLAGNLAADLRGDVPAIDFNLRSDNVNVGTLLAQLGVAEGLDLTAGRFDLKLAMRGASTRAILERSEFSAGIHNGLWRIRDPNMKGTLEISLPEGTISAKRGKPIALALDGRIDRTPVRITVTTDPLASFSKPKERLRMDVDMAMAGTELKLTGTAPRPVHAEDLHFKMDFRGNTFSDFDDLLDVSLPPLGPYQLIGEFGSRPSGYYVENLQVKVGESTLNGNLDFQTAHHPHRLNVDLVAETIQLDDFDTGEWSPLGKGEEEDKQPKLVEKPRTAGETVEEVRAVLSPEVMRGIDAKVTLNVRDVLSGRDRLGSGSMIATLMDGRAQVDPLTLNLPGGSVDVGFAFEPTATDVGLEARAKIEHLDYGILARRIDPASDVGGIISADVDVDTRGENLDNVMNAANGHIDFAVWPGNLEADLFDLWAVNLFVAMMPSLDGEAKSKVNCIVARFTLQDGIMRPSALFIDSTNVQASGDGVIDFKVDTIAFSAAPQPKKPQMFSAQTPVQVSGRISDIKIGLGSGALLGTIVRMVTSPVVVPFQWIFTDSEPADGKIACQRAWGRPPPS